MWLREQLARRVDGSSLGLFRILWGLLMVWESIRKLPKADGMYSPEYFHFTYSLFPFVKPLPEVWMMQTEISVMLIAAILITIGYYYRAASAVFLVIFTHLFLIEKIYYNNHFYLTILMSFLMMLCEADRCYRLPLPGKWGRKKETDLEAQTVPLWNLVLLRSQIVVLYFFGGVAKLNSDWLAGEPVRFWFSHKDPSHMLSMFLTQGWFIYMVCWTGLILDLVAGFTLLSKRTRVFTMLLLVVFHATNSTLFQIGLFPLIGIGLLILFVEPVLPRKCFRWIGTKLGTIPHGVLEPHIGTARPVKLASWGVTAFVCGWISFQAILPLRILTYSDDPGWSEVGQCFSWRMMLRHKDAFLKLKFDPPEAEKYLEEHPEILPHLSKVHVERMVKNPHFILQYAHTVSDALKKEGWEDVKISCVSIASMNGRPYQLMINPETDLAKASYGMFEVPDWIVPLDKYQRPGQYPKTPEERRDVIAQVYKEHVPETQEESHIKSRVKYASAIEYSGSIQ
ncbi:HTTM domain-containing protein [Thalassoglobus polymorphus]|uniref:Vitamin K-dependent gamma-carboxylase n=1 Tax=Thalassoglobus polymorphus TaxID=2527994 RepID=A0A517QLL7_9PLAN|nr:HTTM domain-containing protein [Thalassoglobus polymorphus]QDT32509.1 Vitamin K-dependent gamma-carboxylase [Thalassoglobus polymorphus]